MFGTQEFKTTSGKRSRHVPKSYGWRFGSIGVMKTT